MVAPKIPSGSLLDLARRGYLEPAAMLAEHESGHAAVAMFVALDIEYATIDDAARDGGGRCQLVSTDREPELANLLVTLAGNLAHGDAIGWKPLDVGHGDESTAALLVDYLELDYDGWLEAVELTRQMLEVPQVVRARKALAAALYERGTLDGAQVKALYDGRSIEAADL